MTFSYLLSKIVTSLPECCITNQLKSLEILYTQKHLKPEAKNNPQTAWLWPLYCIMQMFYKRSSHVDITMQLFGVKDEHLKLFCSLFCSTLRERCNQTVITVHQKIMIGQKIRLILRQKILNISDIGALWQMSLK